MSLKEAGKHIVKGNFGMALSAISSRAVNSSSYRGGSGMWLFNQMGGVDINFSYDGLSSIKTAYETCAPLSAILARKANAYINGKTWVMTQSGKGKMKESFSEAATKIRKLLSKPNPLQSWKQFEAQGYMYQQLFGFNVVLAIKPNGFKNIDASSIWNIPPQMLEFEEKKGVSLYNAKSIKDFVSAIYFNWNDERKALDLESVTIFKDNIPSLCSFILPETRINALETPINNIIGAYKSRGALIYDRGALGIISSDKSDESGKVALTAKEKQDVQEEFRKYGSMSGQFKYIITNAALKWQGIGFSTKDLMLFEEIEDDVQRICDSYNYPYRLLSSNKGNSLGGSDVNEYKKLLYQDAIIPESEMNYEHWNLFFNTSELNLIIEKDYSQIGVLQDDKLKEGQARKVRNEALQIEFYNNLITLNRWLELNGEDTLTTPEGSMYYYQLISAGWSFGANSNNQNQEQYANNEPNAGAASNEV